MKKLKRLLNLRKLLNGILVISLLWALIGIPLFTYYAAGKLVETPTQFN